MVETSEWVSMKLLDAGEHKDRILKILSNMKGTEKPPAQLISHPPCLIATPVQRHRAEKTQGLLEKAGAIILLDNEEQGSSSERPRRAPEQTETAPPQEATPTSISNLFRNILSHSNTEKRLRNLSNERSSFF